MFKSVAVAVTTAFSALGLAVAAQAAEPSYGNINPKATGSITVYKHENNPAGTPVGAVADKVDKLKGISNPIAEVKFRSFMVTNKPLTGQGAADSWKAISEVTTAQLESACDAVKPNEGKPTLNGFAFADGEDFAATNAEGKTEKTGLAVGSYVVCEVETPARVLNRATPFIVTIPHPDTKTKQWHYDVTVYPKNTVGGITKTIEEQIKHGLGQGSEIHWPVSVSLPQLPTDEHLAYLIVQDDLTDITDANTTSRYASRDVASVKLFASDNDQNPVVLEKETDFKVHDTSNVFDVGLTKSGLTKAEGKQGGKLVVTFKTTLNSSSVADGILKNKAKLFMKTYRHTTPNNPPTDSHHPPSPPGPGVPPGEDGNIPPFPDKPPVTPEVESHWGNAKLKKVDAADNTAPLEGAKFQVYAATKETAYLEDCSKAEKDTVTGPLMINNSQTFASNSSGEVAFGALFVSDSVHEPIKKPYRCYVVVETEAPAGYALPAGDKAEFKMKVTTGQVTGGGYNVTVSNTKTTVPGLPLTGANGRILLILLGTAVIAIAGGAWVAYLRKTRKS